MTTLERWISQACDALGLQADFAYVVDVGDDREVRAVARIRGIGARNGMLVVRKYDDVRPFHALHAVHRRDRDPFVARGVVGGA